LYASRGSNITAVERLLLERFLERGDKPYPSPASEVDVRRKRAPILFASPSMLSVPITLVLMVFTGS
jgi:hypothetical protein